ncbi:MAG: adenylosuccinate synthase, partial [Armatimonadetes bacterium]|nr:adenylosuccinate synthase [Armatimonadota bacterium]
MKNTLILGTQWGDEGKGKVTHYLARQADVVARYSGGNNAGHTVVIGTETYKLHQIPSGIFFERCDCMMGNGMVVDVRVLLEEIEGLQARGISMERLKISYLAHVIMPYHLVLDGVSEARRGEQSLGTTRRGIGPAYSDKVARNGIRVMDLLDADSLRELITFNLRDKAHALADVALQPDPMVRDYLALGERLRPYIDDTSYLLHQRWKAGKSILFEGAQGALLDVDLGTYPFVTSSNSGPGYAGAGLGISPKAVDCVLGVVKAYTTRVGTGPFPTELEDATGERLRKQGGEFGTTTGRPRRCGWLDLVALEAACRVHGVDALAITKLDVLGGFDPLRVCTAYRHAGKTLERFPLSAKVLAECEPVYEDVPGWSDTISDVRR